MNQQHKNDRNEIAARAAWSAPLETLENRQHMDATAVQATPFRLDFSSPVGDSVKDKDGKGTGFTRVQDNDAHNAYQPDKIQLDTATGTLKITTVGNALYGSSGGLDNAQTNALETQFDGNQKNFSIETRLIGPLSNLNDRYEQAGIYFGADQDNYVKLVAMRNWNGQYLCFEDEYSNGTGGVTTTRNGTNAQTNIGSFASINTLDLKLVGDASTGVVTAYWRVNSDSGGFSQVGFSITIPTAKRATFFNAMSRAGIVAAHKNDVGPITATFDSFAINGGTPVITQPTITAINGVTNGATNVRRDPTMVATVTFAAGGSTTINASTLGNGNVRLVDSDGVTVAASVTVGSGGNTIVVKPTNLLDPSKTYTLSITANVKDANGVAFAPYSVSFTTVAAATSAASASVAKSTFYFSDVRGDANASATQSVRITNTGSAALILNSLSLGGTNAGDFQLVGAPSGSVTINPGASYDVSFAFKATAVGLRFATLSVATNDAANPTLTINLRGLGTAGEGGASEPSLQRIFDLYQLGINTGDTTPDVSNDFPATVVGPDEVAIQRLKKAGSGNVTIELLGNFANSVSPSSIFGWYRSGSPQGRTKLFQVDKAYAQTVNPVINGANSFDPGSASFGIYGEFPAFPGRVVTSEKQFNTWDSNAARQQKVRFWALKDANGNVVPNAYVFAFEEYGVEFDQNDIVGIIRNVAPDAAGANIGIQNMDGQGMFNDRLIMNRIRDTQVQDDVNFYIPNTVHDQATLRITNSGDSPLIVSNVTISNAEFEIVSGGGSFTLAAGATRDVVVKFVYNRTGGGNEYRSATLTIVSNDADESNKTVTLAGLWQAASENGSYPVSQEATLGKILQTLGYNINVGNLNTAGNAIRAGEEILSEYWYAADLNIPVGVRMLAAFHQQKSNTNSQLRWGTDPTASGTNLIRHLASDGQSFLPRTTSGAVGYAEFNPSTSKFAWRVDQPWSVDARNQTSVNSAAFPISDGGHAFRFYAAKDASGKLIPNTYIMAMDYVGQSYSNYDYQDNIYLVTGVRPASGPLAPSGFAAASNAAGINLSWSASTEGNLAGYNVYRSTSSGGTYSKVNGALLTTTSYLDETANAGITYYYRLVAVDYHGTESTTPAAANATRAGDTLAPATPANANAVGSASSIALLWLDNTESDLAGYNVYRASSLDGPYVKLNASLLTANNYTDLTAPVAANSYYRITAVDQTGNESVAASVNAYRAAAGSVPAAPTSLAAGATATNSVTLTWADNAGDETNYLVERRNADGSYSQIASLGANVTTYTDAGLTSGTTYAYRVRALNASGPSAYSNVLTATTVLAVPPAPTALAATALTANAVRLTWTDNSTSESGFRVERRVGTGAWTLVDSVGANIVSYVDASAAAGTAYEYRVTAYNAAGSGVSATASATTPAAQGFTSVDIGGPKTAGSTTVVSEGKDYDLRAGGADVWGTSDQFRFVYRQVTGDFDYSMRVTDLTQTDIGSMVGLMARESLDANSKHVFMRTRPDAAGGMRANYRDATGGASGSTGNAPVDYPNVWLRLQRVGNTFNAYGSTDGTTWNLMLSRTMSMGGTVYLGIAASARTTGTGAMTAKVRDLTDRKASVVPAAPDQLVGTSNTAASNVTLYWRDNATNETGYRVERRARTGDTWSTIATLGANVATYVDGTVSVGNSYVYRVVATNAAGSSPASDELNVDVLDAAPAAPSSLSATNASGGVQLAWTDESSNESGFVVERRLASGSTWTTLSSSVAANATSYTDATAAANTAYVYRVRANGVGGNSAYSAEATVTTPAIESLTSVNIGTTGGSTTVVTEGSAYTVAGGGADVWGTSDQFRFVYKQLTGDFDVRVRVSSLTYVEDGTMAGLMARATLDADSRQVYIKARANGTTNMSYRGSTAGNTTATASATTPFPNAWVRLVRVGNTFTTYTSADGVTWATLGSVTQSMPNTLYVGLAVSAHQAGQTTTATFDNLTFA